MENILKQAYSIIGTKQFDEELNIIEVDLKAFNNAMFFLHKLLSVVPNIKASIDLCNNGSIDIDYRNIGSFLFLINFQNNKVSYYFEMNTEDNNSFIEKSVFEFDSFSNNQFISIISNLKKLI